MKAYCRIFINSISLLLVVIALFCTGMRFLLPHLNIFRQPIENQLQYLTGSRVTMGDLQGSWWRFGPSLQIQHLTLDNNQYQLSIQQLGIDIDLWRSLLHGDWHLRTLHIEQLQLQQQPTHVPQANTTPQTTIANKKLLMMAVPFQRLKKGVLQQIDQLTVSNSQVSFIMPNGQRADLAIKQINIDNVDQQHQGNAEFHLQVAQQFSGSLRVQLNLHDTLRNSLNDGMIYWQLTNASLAPWLNKRQSLSLSIVDGIVNATGWLRIDRQQLEQAIIHITDSQLQGDDQNKLRLSHQWLWLDQQTTGWRLTLPNLLQNKPQPHLDNNNLSIEWQTAKQKPHQIEQLQLQVNQFSLDNITSLLSFYHDPNNVFIKAWLTMKPQGRIDKLTLDFPWNAPKQSQIKAEWDDISWQAWQDLPGINHFSGTLEGNLTKAELTFNLQNSTLPYPTVFAEPLEIKQARGYLYWQHQQEQWQLTGQRIDIQARSLWINGDFDYQQNNHRPWLSILAGINLQDVRDIWRYYPESLMGKPLINYLTKAIQGGNAHNATLIFNGNPEDFPFKQKQGKFEVWMPLKAATLQFQPDWKPITQLEIDLNFINQGLWMQASSGQLDKIRTSEIVAAIPDFQHSPLYVDAHVYTTSQQLHDYLKYSPLQDSVAAALEYVNITGNVDGLLHLTIPLSNEGEVEASGRIRLDNNEVTIEPLNLQLSEVQGDFKFTNNTLEGKQLKANWLGQPIAIHFDSQNQATDHRINVDLTGDWSLAKLLSPLIPAKMNSLLEANVQWQSHVNITLPNNKAPHYHIDLEGAVSQPSPLIAELFSCQTTSICPIQLTAKGNTKQLTLEGQLSYYDLMSRWNLSDALIELERGYFRYRDPHQSTDLSVQPVMTGEQPKVDISLPAINGHHWLALIATLSKQKGTKVFQWPETLQISTPSLYLADQYWPNVQLFLNQQKQGFAIAVASDNLQGKLSTDGSDHWQLDLEKLYYNPSQNKKNRTKTVAPSVTTGQRSTGKKKANSVISSFKQWPTVTFQCHECWLYGQRFGLIKGKLTPQDKQLRLSEGLIDNGLTHLQLSGEWSINETSKTIIKGQLSGQQFEQSMQYFGFNSPIDAKSYQTDFTLMWLSEPWQPAIKTLSGTLSANLRKGKIKDATSKTTGFIMRFSSISALIDKLRTDSQGVFSNDFGFSTIRVDSKIEQGILHTDNLLINGELADIKLKGDIDFIHWQIAMRAMITPHFSEVVGIATALAVNPMMGVAAFTASKALAPLWHKVSFIHYRINGSLDGPKVSGTLNKQNNNPKVL